MAEVIRDCDSGCAFIVGHSVGGLVGVYLAASAPAAVAGLVLVDTRLKPPSVASTPVTERVEGRGEYRAYETKQQGIARFRLVPADTMADPATLHFLAKEGLRRVADGWTWKSDPNALRRFTDEAVRERLAEVACPVGYVFGERSLFGGMRSAQHLEQRLRRPISIRSVAGAFHHVPLDAPIECAATIHDILSGFQEASRR
jgi:pimeloyl-ACP methyl ester carboxylesterase